MDEEKREIFLQTRKEEGRRTGGADAAQVNAFRCSR